MNLAQYNISFNAIKNVLKEFGLYRMKGIKDLNSDGVSDEFRQESIKTNYLLAYRKGLENHDYDILLKDQSYFQFECKFGEFIEARYSFFQNPIEYISYEDYILQEIGDEGVGNMFEEEYHQFLNEQDLISNYSTFRFDFDKNNYRPLIHSVSHFHIGHLNNVRIPLNKVISPLRFVLFTIKHVYYDVWKSCMENKPEVISKLLNESIKGEVLLEGDDWHKMEELELYIS